MVPAVKSVQVEPRRGAEGSGQTAMEGSLVLTGLSPEQHGALTEMAAPMRAERGLARPSPSGLLVEERKQEELPWREGAGGHGGDLLGSLARPLPPVQELPGGGEGRPAGQGEPSGRRALWPRCYGNSTGTGPSQEGRKEESQRCRCLRRRPM